MRRNDIVLVGNDCDPRFYGRINRVVDAENYEVAWCGRNFGAVHQSKLSLSNDYKGYSDFYTGRFLRMPSLRKLKQAAAFYNKAAWKKYR